MSKFSAQKLKDLVAPEADMSATEFVRNVCRDLRPRRPLCIDKLEWHLGVVLGNLSWRIKRVVSDEGALAENETQAATLLIQRIIEGKLNG